MIAPPFSTLTPDLILDAIDSVNIMGDGRLLALNSYENRVYQLGVEDQAPVIVKFYRPERWSKAQILEEHHFSLELAEEEIPVVEPLMIEGSTLQEYQGFYFAVFPRRGGRIPELDQEGRLEWIGRFLGRIHTIGARKQYVHRPGIDVNCFGADSAQWLLDHQFIPPDLIPAYRSVVDQALEGVQHCYERAGQVPVLRLHGDCHLSNLLWTDDGPHFVDFDDSRTGPAIQDLWMLLSGSHAEMSLQFAELLEGYECFCDFNPAELHLIEALRTLRLIHYSAWLARRWEDPAFPMTFTWFNTQQYWQERILELREQIALMQELPLSVVGGNR
ncbi:Ser/Thr protein kinase RdoA involved in Cpx stress response, MazF antagonist [Methylobacillus rhizosphaerae]|uniref:Stress response kinase A n=1 Tax=Methylobacillus rhizosphaerae TaxID=551994 RepID=A0A239B5F0_9PROT|nr:serine/threonine protein kinase [Methylobacillus rhizosphaerae]SNS02832.1 Ser/Thr protein kinase RdoA involved in Cpx stress response, MazF antagonist [Methylobacillus rhizosphaerae]